ncbi:putative ribonuclease H-like domain-containing protein [Tanacetum coccineum]
MSQPANDDFSQYLSDDEASYHEDASDNDYFPPVSAEKYVVEMERRLRTIFYLMAIPKEQLRRFPGYERCKRIIRKHKDSWKPMVLRVSPEDASQFLGSLPPALSNLAMTMRTKPDVDTFSIDDLYNNLRVFEQELTSTSRSSASAQNIAFISNSKSSTNKVKSGYTVIYSLFAKQSEYLDLLHEDLEQINNVDIEEMDINWQIAMIVIRMKKFYKKTGRRVRIDGNKPVGFDTKKLECFKCHNTGHFSRECTSKGTNDGKKRDYFYQDQGAGKKEQKQNCLMAMDDGVVNWGEHSVKEEETNHALMAISSNNEVSLCNEIYAKDEKLKKYRRIGMKAVKEKEQLQKTVDSWKNSSKNLWKLIDSGMTSNSKVGLGYQIQSNNEVLSYEKEMNRTVVISVQKKKFLEPQPLYSRFSKTDNFKGVPHPLIGDYTPKPQEEIDDSLYVYGKKGPQKPETSVLDDKFSKNSVTSSEEVVSEPKLKEAEPSCVTHVKTLRQPMKNQGTPKVKGKSWNEMMERELGEGYSFIKKKCFVCGSLSHLIRDCDFYEKKMARDVELKKQRVFNTGNGVAKPVWNNANRVNRANHFIPRPVQLNIVRQNVNSVKSNVNTGRANVNSVKSNVNSVRHNVNSVKSNVNSVRHNVNSVRTNVNTGRSKQPVPTSNSNSISPVRSQVNKFNQRSHFSKSHSPVRRPIVRNTTRMTYSNVVKGYWGIAVKTSAGYN